MISMSGSVWARMLASASPIHLAELKVGTTTDATMEPRPAPAALNGVPTIALHTHGPLPGAPGF